MNTNEGKGEWMKAFLILEDGEMARLKEQVNFDIWERYDEGHTVVRFATSWATKREDVEKVISFL